jgi:hypothetical protein
LYGYGGRRRNRSRSQQGGGALNGLGTYGPS